MTQTVYLVLTCREQPQVFATRELAVASVKFTFHNIPDQLEEVHEGVRYLDKTTREFIDIVDTVVHNTVNHL
jgi:hypothetical protein